MPAPTATVTAPTPNIIRSRRVNGRLNTRCSTGFGRAGIGTSSTSMVGAEAGAVALATGSCIVAADFLRFDFLRPEDFDRCLPWWWDDLAGGIGLAAGTAGRAAGTGPEGGLAGTAAGTGAGALAVGAARSPSVASTSSQVRYFLMRGSA